MAARAAAAAADGVIGVCEAVDDELVCDDESDDCDGGGGGGGGAGVALGGVVDEHPQGASPVVLHIVRFHQSSIGRR